MLTGAESVSELLPSQQAFGGQNNHGDISESRVCLTTLQALLQFVPGIIMSRNRSSDAISLTFTRDYRRPSRAR